MQKSVAESGAERRPVHLGNVYRHLGDMENYRRPVTCRHRACSSSISGCRIRGDGICGACDLCAGESETLPDADMIAKKILSCVYRVNWRVSGSRAHSGAAILRQAQHGGDPRACKRARQAQHLHGLLKEYSQRDLTDWIGQLIGLGLVIQAGNEYPILKLNAAFREVMKDLRRSCKLKYLPASKAAAESDSSRDRSRRSRTYTPRHGEGVDRDLFDQLRKVRQDQAGARGVPPYLIFGDATLRELARVRLPSLGQPGDDLRHRRGQVS